MGSSATMAGVRYLHFVNSSYRFFKEHIRMLPYSLGSSLTSALAGYSVSRFKAYRPIIWTGFFTMTLGLGLMILLDDRSSLYVW